jgi:hypothetical protein
MFAGWRSGPVEVILQSTCHTTDGTTANSDSDSDVPVKCKGRLPSVGKGHFLPFVPHPALRVLHP